MSKTTTGSGMIARALEYVKEVAVRDLLTDLDTVSWGDLSAIYSSKRGRINLTRAGRIVCCMRVRRPRGFARGQPARVSAVSAHEDVAKMVALNLVALSATTERVDPDLIGRLNECVFSVDRKRLLAGKLG